MRILLAALVLALAAFAATRAVRVESDFTAFLPNTTTPEERLLVAQLRDGLVARLMLVALEGGDAPALANASRQLAGELAKAPEFAFASNGASFSSPAMAEALVRNRYVLSPRVAPGAFSDESLRRALEERLDELSAPVALPTRALLPRDPTGELTGIYQRLVPGTQPAMREGVWFTADGKSALLIAQTRAPGYDSVAQAAAIARVRSTLAAIDPALRPTLSGPGVFAAESHRIIEHDVEWLGVCATVGVLLLLGYVYRSLRAIALVAMPVVLGLLAGVLAVQWGFGSVHAITLGFGATLVGEAVDYPNYVLVQTQGEGSGAIGTVGHTLGLAVLTTVASALALALSGFQGLAQLGVLTMAGILAAGIATRYLVPWLAAGRAPIAHPLPFAALLQPFGGRVPRSLVAVLTLLTLGGLAATYPAWRENDLSAISPIPETLRLQDAALRREMGAPDVSYLVASRGPDEGSALANAEAALPLLEGLKAKGVLAGYESATALLPSPATQRARVEALPASEVLESNLRAAQRGLPFKPDTFAPFLADVEAARTAPLLTRSAYAGTPAAARLDALLVQQDGAWLALTPVAGLRDAAALEAALAGSGSQLVDLKRVTTGMLDGYLRESSRQVALGAGLIALLLVVGLRSFARATRVLLPSAAALALTTGALAACGIRLGVFHLVALLLVLGIGLNYALFLEAAVSSSARRARAAQALALCVATTVLTFGLLASSATPVLRAIGLTVAIGASLSVLLALAWTPRERAFR